jgi:hypothetical protein
MTIKHGAPVQSGYALIAQPGLGVPIGDRIKTPPLVITLECPIDGTLRKYQLIDMWRFTLNDKTEENLINAWAKLSYGITGPQLIGAMRKKYPKMTNQIEFFLIKKHEG